MKRLFLTWTILLFVKFLFAQNIDPIGCATGLFDMEEYGRYTDCDKSSADYNFYKAKESFLPDSTDEAIIVHVNLNIWQRSDGTGNWVNTPEVIGRIEQIFAWVDHHISWSTNFTLAPTYPVANMYDTKIRIQLDSVFFYQDPSSDSTYFYGINQFFCDSLQIHEHYPSTAILQNYLETNYPNRIKALNVHITGGEMFCRGAGFWQSNAVQTFYRKVPDMTESSNHDWFLSMHIAHEIGHALGLMHIYDRIPSSWQQNCSFSQVDFLWDVFDTTEVCGTTCDVCLIPSVKIIGSDTIRNNNIMGGGDISHTSDLQKAIMHRNLRVGNINSGGWTAGKGIRDHATGYIERPFEITQDETWDFSIKFYQDIVVKSGNTLTITCEVQMVPEAKILIEPGAKLILDGGVLTKDKYTTSRWKGIQIYGQPEMTQSPAHQGLLETKRGAVIEFADQAVQVWQQDVWNTMGGIVQASSTTFRNNGKAVAFFPYKNIQPNGMEMKNWSYFSNCEFIADDDFIGNAPVTQFTMYQVNGVLIQNCLFEDKRTNVTIQDRLSGILTLDASFRIVGTCPHTDICDLHYYDEVKLNKTLFKNLKVGVHAQNAQTISQATIDRCHFENVQKGVYIDAADNAIITRNLFEFTNDHPTDMYFSDQITVLGATSYRIEGNTMRADNPSGAMYGVQIHHSGMEPTEVYRNRYTENFVANGAVGVNRNYLMWNTDPSLSEGLQFQCNTYEDNAHDLVVNSTSEYIPGEGIQDWQGSLTISAGNTFDNTSDKSLVNLAAHESIFTYFYFEPNANEEPINSSEVPQFEAEEENPCPSSFETIVLNPVGPLLNPILYPYVVGVLDSIQFDLDTKMNILNANLSLGDTSVLYSLIPTILYDQSETAFLILESMAPYLSENVLYLLADVDPAEFSHTFLRDICILHPEISHKSDFIDYLGSKSTPMPQVMIDSILNSPKYSTLSYEYADIRGLKKQKEDVTTGLLMSTLLDSIYPTLGFMDSLVAHREHFLYPFEMMQAALWKSDRTRALDILSYIGAWLATERTGLDALTELIVEDYVDFHYELLQLTTGTYLEGIDSTAEVLIRHYATEGIGFTQIQAENFLCFFFNECDIPHYEYIPAQGLVNTQNNEKKQEWVEEINKDKTISLYPNPASELVTLDFGDIAEKALLAVYNANGQYIMSDKVNDVSSYQLSIHNWQPGLYIVRVRLNNRSETLRLIVN